MEAGFSHCPQHSGFGGLGGWAEVFVPSHKVANEACSRVPGRGSPSVPFSGGEGFVAVISFPTCFIFQLGRERQKEGENLKVSFCTNCSHQRLRCAVMKAGL